MAAPGPNLLNSEPSGLKTSARSMPREARACAWADAAGARLAMQRPSPRASGAARAGRAAACGCRRVHIPRMASAMARGEAICTHRKKPRTTAMHMPSKVTCAVEFMRYAEGLCADDLQMELRRCCEAEEAKHAHGVAENEALAEANAELRAMLLARQRRFDDLECAAGEEEVRATAQRLSLERALGEESAQLETLREFLACARADAAAVETVRLVERERNEEATVLRAELERQAVALTALSAEVAEARLGSTSSRARADAEADAAFERRQAAAGLATLAEEFHAARRELEELQQRSEQADVNADALEYELHCIGAGMRAR
eukprot:NODE_3086_length_2095_cov_2.946646.p2 GENE.NODE_3086_length_2095_cov_2.946646~~NODE_3086_length_2095_cov_2.946646.p2  ORF type:complete len:321 (-),score=105.41 NODE_3086_length_2095_cov_2.946646:701-1663(-)